MRVPVRKRGLLAATGLLCLVGSAALLTVCGHALIASGYERVQEGMSMQEVEALLGPPCSGDVILVKVQKQGEWVETTEESWYGRDASDCIRVYFDKNGKVCYKFHNARKQNLLKRLMSRLGF